MNRKYTVHNPDCQFLFGKVMLFDVYLDITGKATIPGDLLHGPRKLQNLYMKIY